MTIISTKSLALSQENLVLNAGVGLVHFNVLEVTHLNPVVDIPSYNSHILITSKNAAHFLKRFDKSKCTIYCVGSVTSQIVVDAGFKVGYMAFNAQQLADYIINHHAAQSFIYLCGMQRRDELPLALLASQIDFKEVKVYDTTAVKRAYSRIFDAVLCYSPRGVYAFAEANPQPHKYIVCIGETTATEARKFYKNVVVATHPTVENTLVTAIKVLKK